MQTVVFLTNLKVVACLARAFYAVAAEEERDVRLVRPLVLSEAQVAINAVLALLWVGVAYGWVKYRKLIDNLRRKIYKFLSNGIKLEQVSSS